jgi:hypothetical protein
VEDPRRVRSNSFARGSIEATRRQNSKTAAHEAAELKDRGALVEMISPAYSDARGNSREDIENLFRFYFLRAKKVGLLVSIDDIEIFDESAAQVRLTVAMAATTDSALGFNADAYEFELDLEQADSEWLLVSGRWNDVRNELR